MHQKHRGRNAIGIMYAFNFLKNLQFFGALTVPFFLHRAGLDYTRMFLLEACFSFGMIVLEIPTGVVADRFGRKFSLISGCIAFAGGFFLFGITVNYSLLLAGELICALGMSLISGADRALLYEVLKDSGNETKAAEINARYDAAGSIALFLAFPAGTLFASSGWIPYTDALGLVMTATAAMIILGGTVLFWIREPARVRNAGSALRAGVDGFRYIFRIPSLTRFCLNYAIISALTFFMFWFYQSLLIENRFPIAGQGFVAAGFNIGAMILLLSTGIIKKRIGIRQALFLSSLIPGLLYLGIFFIPGLPMAFAGIFGVTMLKMFRAPMLTALMNTHIDSTNRATVLSGVSMLERMVTTAFYPLAGILTDRSLKWTFLVMGTVTVIASLLLRVDEEHLNGGQGGKPQAPTNPLI